MGGYAPTVVSGCGVYHGGTRVKLTTGETGWRGYGSNFSVSLSYSKIESLFKQSSAKGWGDSVYSTCLASTRPWVSTATKKEKKKSSAFEHL
jgi:hypothetical protein